MILKALINVRIYIINIVIDKLKIDSKNEEKEYQKQQRKVGTNIHENNNINNNILQNNNISNTNNKFSFNNYSNYKYSSFADKNKVSEPIKKNSPIKNKMDFSDEFDYDIQALEQKNVNYYKIPETKIDNRRRSARKFLEENNNEIEFTMNKRTDKPIYPIHQSIGDNTISATDFTRRRINKTNEEGMMIGDSIYSGNKKKENSFLFGMESRRAHK